MYEGTFTISFNCIAACRRTASCINGANGVFTGPGVNGDSASCPITCDPGFNRSASNYCVAPPICLNCAYATRTGLTGHTRNSITDIAKLERELASVRALGIARDDEELEPGVRCMAAGVYDDQGKLVAAVGCPLADNGIGHW
jgi:hypothetical protein